ncbi:hypothetical protein RB595_006623 [Gaeumannomyces hyphopodioides]
MANINPRTVMAPMAAFTMACILFTYTRSSIREARLNAQMERDAYRRKQQQNPPEEPPR